MTPKDLLTKDETWINKPDLISEFDSVVRSVPNPELRAQLNHYFSKNLPKPRTKKDGTAEEPAPKDIASAIWAMVRECPVFLDYYIKYKEAHGDSAASISEEKVLEVQEFFVTHASQLISALSKSTSFYSKKGDTLEESYARVQFLKDVIENKDGYRIFYTKGKPVKRELDIQILFRLTWYATEFDVTPEANAGRGPVDYKISKGAADKTLFEFKLASNSKLAQNLKHQVEIYKRAHDTDKEIKAIIFFTAEEHERVKQILKDLKLDKEKYVVLIDARNDNKPSASKAKNS